MKKSFERIFILHLTAINVSTTKPDPHYDIIYRRAQETFGKVHEPDHDVNQLQLATATYFKPRPHNGVCIAAHLNFDHHW